MTSSEPVYYCPDFTIYIQDSSIEEDEKVVFKPGTQFKIPIPGIYSLEGPNRVGKSILIRFIMGALPSGFFQDNKSTATIIGVNKRVKIRNVKEAVKYGLVAVFQDDNLIPTMTIMEQIKLRHSKPPGAENWLYNIWFSILHFFSGEIFHFFLTPFWFIYRLVKKVEPSEEKAYPELKIEKKIKELFKQFELEEKYLDNFPQQLSGGTRDLVRIINALLTENIKVLFLDEALSHINDKQKILVIEKLKNWREQNETSIVVVSHDKEERLRWQPRERFFIDEKEKTIKTLDYKGYSGLESGIVLQTEFFPKFDTIDSASSFLAQCSKPFLFLVEQAVSETAFCKSFLEGFSYQKTILKIQISERHKSIEEYKKIVKEVAEAFPKSKGTIVIIGGGVMLNFGAFVAATLHRGLVPHILIPTTVMAIADVAIGSKASINIEDKPDYSSKKHIVGAYTNPVAVIMDIQFLKSLPNLEKKFGLAECLKHGMLQDESLFNDVYNLIEKEKPEPELCFAYAIRTQKLKSSTLMNDPFEMKYGRVLLYGHLHAHSIERIKNLDVPHGLAVFWGMALELKIANNLTTYDKVIKLIQSSSDLSSAFKKIIAQIKKNETEFYDNLKLVYQSDTKPQHSSKDHHYNIIPLNFIGCYSEIGCDIEAISVEWKVVEKNIRSFIAELEIEPE